MFNALVHNTKDTTLTLNISQRSGVIIEIKDRGNGIEEEALNKVSEGTKITLKFKTQ